MLHHVSDSLALKDLPWPFLHHLRAMGIDHVDLIEVVCEFPVPACICTGSQHADRWHDGQPGVPVPVLPGLILLLRYIPRLALLVMNYPDFLLPPFRLTCMALKLLL